MLSKHFCKVFYNSFFRYIKISKKLSAKDYQEKERLQKLKKKKEKEKKLVKDIKMFLKKKRKKSNKMVLNVTKISQKMMNKRLLSIKQNIVKWEKMPNCNYKKYLFLKIKIQNIKTF